MEEGEVGKRRRESHVSNSSWRRLRVQALLLRAGPSSQLHLSYSPRNTSTLVSSPFAEEGIRGKWSQGACMFCLFLLQSVLEAEHK